MLAMVIFDARGRILRVAPDSLLFAELPLDDYVRLLKLESISRYDPAFPLDRYFTGIGGAPEQRRTPVLEVLLPLHGRDATIILGFAQYYIDARPLAQELAASTNASTARPPPRSASACCSSPPSSPRLISDCAAPSASSRSATSGSSGRTSNSRSPPRPPPSASLPRI